MASKRQTTMAKLAREQAVRERRARKLQKREAKLEAAAAKRNARAGVPDAASDEAGQPEEAEEPEEAEQKVDDGV